MTRRSNQANVYRLSLCALLLAMMLILGYVESMIPLNTGVPGIKLGLSNGVLIFAVYMLDIPAAFVLMSLKVVLSGALFAGVSTMMYGFAGGVLSLLCMAALSRIKRLPVPAVSIIGGVMHNVGQLTLSLLILRVPPQSMLLYLLVLTGVGAVCGLLTGVCARSVMTHLRHMPWQRVNANQNRLLPWIIAVLCVLAVGFACWQWSGVRIAPPEKQPAVEWSSGVPEVQGLPQLPRQSFGQ